MGLIASPCSWSWFKLLTLISWCPACCQDMFQKGLSTATESAVTLSTVREMMYFTKTKRSYFRFAPAPYRRKSPTGPLQSTPHPRAQMAGRVPMVARGIVTGLTNCTVHQWHFSSIRSLFSLARSRCVHLLKAVVFGSYWNFWSWGNSQRQEQVMGFFPSPNPTSREIPQVGQEFDNPSIIIHFFTPWIGSF